MIVWMVEKMNNEASNKLLKLLEEPPEKTLFLLISENEEDDMRSALLTPKGAPSRKKVVKFKSDKPIIGGSVSMQILRSESITKMNNQLKNVMQDIKNTATKVREYRIASKSATSHDFFFTIPCHRFLASNSASSGQHHLVRNLKQYVKHYLTTVVFLQCI